MMEEKVLTLHPDGKSGVNISRAKYDLMRETIVSVLGEQIEMTFTELGAEVGRRLEGRFDGSISWYYTTVKLDLEARGIVERMDSRSPQRIRLAQG
ncbi:MAG: hypothetical protein JSW55_03820 [Chloroflexota bacterium]|nr:MAG: hypothetical protein JSW55_03820 [Chloroflexota bacterium]